MSALTQALVDVGFNVRRAEAIEAAITGALPDAEDVAFTPAGTIAATDVQAAIEELDSETQASLSTKEPADAAILKSDESENVTVGYTATAENIGTISSGTVTPDPATGNLKRYVNNGGHTLAPPSASGDYTIVIQVTNGASAGTITTSGFTKVTGNPLTNTNGHDFLFFITKLNGFTHLNVVALQ